MLHLIRRIFLVTGALALALPSLSAVVFACPLPTAHSEAAASPAGRHEGAHAPMSGTRLAANLAAQVDGVWKASPNAPAPCEHPCPDMVRCLAGASCGGAPTVATLQMATDVADRPHQGIEPADMQLIR